MSRLASLSPAALRAMFSTDSDDSLMMLLTLTNPALAAPVRITENYTHKYEYLTAGSMTVTNLSTGSASAYTYLPADEVIKDAINYDTSNALYGVKSGSRYFLFVPFSMSLPTEEAASSPRCSITIQDVTRLIVPVIRTINTALTANTELVLTSTPDVIEASFPAFKMAGVTYTSSTVSAELTVESMDIEPFPAHTFTPSYFPGIF